MRNERSDKPSRQARAKRSGTGAVILLYHRIEHLPSDPQRLAVRPRHFREHLEILRREYRPISLRELCSGLANGNVPDRAVAMTFDDGYADNFEKAAPLLGEFDIPATMFVTARRDNDREFWWDDLERIILRTPRLPKSISLQAGGSRRAWRLDDGSNKTPSDPAWSVQSNRPPTKRQGLYLLLCRMLRTMPDDRRRHTLDALHRWGRANPVLRPTHRCMTPAQIRQLAKGDLIEIGSHTVTHPVLSALPLARQYAEIAGGSDRLTEIIGRPVKSFAYPFGCARDFTSETVELVRSAGHLRACANTGKPLCDAAIVTPRSNPFKLPRAIVRDGDGETFARSLHRLWNAAAHRERPQYATASA